MEWFCKMQELCTVVSKHEFVEKGNSPEKDLINISRGVAAINITTNGNMAEAMIPAQNGIERVVEQLQVPGHHLVSSVLTIDVLIPGPEVLDYSHSGMESMDLEEALENQPSNTYSSVHTLLVANNSLVQLPSNLLHYKNLRTLDISTNHLTFLPESLLDCQNLVSINARNNFLDETSFPKHFGSKLAKLTDLNLSGNQFTRIPKEILDLGSSLTSLHLGANRITEVSNSIVLLRKLEIFYLGGNVLSELPQEIGYLVNLKVFVLCENHLESLPSTVCNLKQLKSLLLHRNRLTSLPIELVKLRNLMELSLRDNPLVVRFVRDLVHNPPSLMELAARTVRIKKVQYTSNDLPCGIQTYLSSAHECVNPRCKGVYFDNCIEHIKFVDFCGKYRIPLLQYLCSPKCSDHQSPAYEASSDSSDNEDDRIRKVLLG